jgi:hypothetical protein
MPQAELTAEAREAIRSFVSLLVIPSGFLLVVLSAVAGFIVKDWALSEANKQLEPKVQTEIDSAQAKLTAVVHDADTKLTAALHDADTKLTELYNTRDKIQASNVAFEVSASNLRTDLQMISRSIPIIESLAPAQVVQLNDLLQKIVTNSLSNNAAVSASKAADSGRSSWDSFIQALSTTEVTTAVGTGSSSRCPSGSYAVGFELLTSPGGAHGIVYGGSMICQAFPHN